MLLMLDWQPRQKEDPHGEDIVRGWSVDSNGFCPADHAAISCVIITSLYRQTAVGILSILHSSHG
jgi:hypothetical protein